MGFYGTLNLGIRGLGVRDSGFGVFYVFSFVKFGQDVGPFRLWAAFGPCKRSSSPYRPMSLLNTFSKESEGHAAILKMTDRAGPKQAPNELHEP